MSKPVLDLTLKNFGTPGAFITAASGPELAAEMAGWGAGQFVESREIAAVADPAGYLTAREAAIRDIYTNDAGTEYTAALNAVNTAVGAEYENSPWVKEIAAERAALMLKLRENLVNLKYPIEGVQRAKKYKSARAPTVNVAAPTINVPQVPVAVSLVPP